MKLPRAREIVSLYGAALAKGSDGGSARKISLLPCDKETIIKAHKLFIAYLIEFKSLDKKTKDGLIVSLSGIGSFVTDKRANEINQCMQMIKSGVSGEDARLKEYRNFMTKEMISVEIMEEIEEFILQVSDLDEHDTLYHQKVYTLAGVEYSPDKKKSFWSNIFG